MSDTSLEELAQEQAIEDAWAELLNDGWLPSGEDMSVILDAYTTEDQGEVAELMRALQEGNQANLTSAAYKIAHKYVQITEGIIHAD